MNWSMFFFLSSSPPSYDDDDQHKKEFKTVECPIFSLPLFLFSHMYIYECIFIHLRIDIYVYIHLVVCA